MTSVLYWRRGGDQHVAYAVHRMALLRLLSFDEAIVRRQQMFCVTDASGNPGALKRLGRSALCAYVKKEWSVDYVDAWDDDTAPLDGDKNDGWVCFRDEMPPYNARMYNRPRVVETHGRPSITLVDNRTHTQENVEIGEDYDRNMFPACRPTQRVQVESSYDSIPMQGASGLPLDLQGPAEPRPDLAKYVAEGQ